MFTPSDRHRIRDEILDAARQDPRLTGGALTGSATTGTEDAWSDIDLAFGVGDPSQMAGVLDDWTKRLYETHGALHHFDVHAGRWIYRVFLLANTLQVDLAFAPADDFGARASTFRLVFGQAADLPHVPPPQPGMLIGYAWLYALHVRSAIARGKLWQAEYMLSAMRDQVLSLACVRHGLPAREGRGLDRLPAEVTRGLERGLVGRLDAAEMTRAFQAVTDGLLDEAMHVDDGLARRIEAALRELSGRSRGSGTGS